MSSEEIRLDTALYIGIAIDVVLAIVAGVLIYKWRKRANEKAERSRHVDRIYGVSQRTETETIPMGSTVGSANPVPCQPQRHNTYVNVQRGTSQSSETRDTENVEGNFAFLNNHPSRPDDGRTYDNSADDVSNDEGRSHVNFKEIAVDDTPQNTHYPTTSDERVVHNPLSATDAALAASTVPHGDPDSPHGEHTAVTTYYTYRPPQSRLDGESSEIISDGERSPTASLPGPHSPPRPLSLNREADDTGSPTMFPPPPPPQPESGHEYSTIDCEVLEDREPPVKPASETVSTKSWSTANFGEEDVARFYNIEMEESTQIL